MATRLTLLLSAGMLLIHAGTRADEAIATSSTTHGPAYLPAYAVDGQLDTRWASGGFRNRPEWLTIDLGVTTAVSEVTLHWEHAYAVEYAVQLSEDKNHWTNLYERKHGKGGVESLRGANGQGRYLRVLCRRPGPHALFSIWELQLSGEGGETLATRRHKLAETRKADEERRRDEYREVLERHGVEEVVFAVRQSGGDGHWYANFGYYSVDPLQKLYRAGGKLCRLNISSGEVVTLIDDPDGTVRDPAVHYDGRRILFSWRKGGTDVFHLYEIRADGSGLRQVTDGEYDDIEPTYLPDGGIAFVSARCKRWVNCWLSPVATIYRCDMDGENVRQLSANIEHDNTPWLLPDGRLVYQRWEYVDRSQVHFHHLWTMNPDGTGQMVYFGNMHPGSVFIDAKPIPGSDRVLLINSPGHGSREHAGHVAMVTDRHGPDYRPALRNITKGRHYRDPFPLSKDAFLVASGRGLLLMDAEGSEITIHQISSDGSGELHEPRPLVSRRREPVISSRVNPRSKTGTLICNNVYFGRNMNGIEPGEIKKLLVLECLPKPVNFTGGMDPLTYGGSFTLERVAGTVPVEADGSVALELPANRAFFFVALDEDNNSVKRMQSFLSVAPGEVVSCVGCHEERGKTPVNMVASGRLQAVKHPPHRLEPIPGIPEVFDFPRDIQPIIDRHCLKCHNSLDRKGGVILSGDRGPMFSLSYAALTIRRQVADGRNLPKSNYPPRALGTSASPLMKKIDGSHHEVGLSEQEQDYVRYWIESAATYPGTYAALGGGSIGGYIRNNLVNTDRDWATHGDFQSTIENRCADCHQQQLGLPLPKSLCDELGMSFWRPSFEDKRMRFSRHLMFNLTHPEASPIVLAPLAESAGGWGTCRQTSTNSVEAAVFADTNDAGYRSLLSHLVAGKGCLEEEITRFDMASFRPHPGYIREMKRYGILDPGFDAGRHILDPYEADRHYWASLWYNPPGEERQREPLPLRGHFEAE